MLRIYLKPSAPHRLEVRPMAAFARPVDVLRQAPLMALDEVVGSGTHRPLHCQGEAELTEHRGLPRNHQPAEADPGDRELPGRGDEVDIVAAARDEGVDQTRRGSFDTAMEGEGAAEA